MDSDSGAISSLDKDDILDPKSIAKRSVRVSNSRPTCFVSNATCASLLLDCSDEAKNLNSNDRVSKKRKKEAVDDRALEDHLQHLEFEEKGEMLNFSDSKAVLAVQEIVALVQSANDEFINNNPALQHLCVETVATELLLDAASSISDNEERVEMLNSWAAIFATLVQSANNMLDKQEDLKQSSVSGHIGKLHDLNIRALSFFEHCIYDTLKTLDFILPTKQTW
jgi:hypothetical protein